MTKIALSIGTTLVVGAIGVVFIANYTWSCSGFLADQGNPDACGREYIALAVTLLLIAGVNQIIWSPRGRSEDRE